jgi:hypothetical protein
MALTDSLLPRMRCGHNGNRGKMGKKKVKNEGRMGGKRGEG